MILIVNINCIIFLQNDAIKQLMRQLKMPLVTDTVARLVSLVAQVLRTFVLFQLDCILIKTQKSLKALFLNFQTF